ncbi:endonuclease/exonuclease/phosphatase family protein [Changchengzhania lutea]|uniref:endonuclease/exonuclease/phosphatase family protein n=1 Tax=Changchengzhania lutea TaxID=2049305 RepID=UPI00115F3D8F|nr:endonuclease/exonuclease/phosphatase family protein [Changchengzhania lutea]
MTKYLLSTLIIVILAGCKSSAELNFSVMTYNVRHGSADDRENSWEYRKDNLSSLIKKHNPDFLGTQEGLPFQIDHINSALPNHSFTGEDRDGNGKGEYSAIFFNQLKYNVLKQHTFRLSPTPNTVSKGWDATYPRICTYGLFKDKKTNIQLWVPNTHLDHIGVMAREQSVPMILNKIKEINTENLPGIFMGDLNVEPESTPILTLKSSLDDSKEISIENPLGPEGSFNAFQFNVPVNKRIDYIFVSKNKKLKVKKYAVLSDPIDLKYPSDHFPFYTELTTNTSQ